MKLMGMRSISDDFQAAQFYTCCKEQMVLTDNVAGNGSWAEEVQHEEAGSSGAPQNKEIRLKKNSHNLYG